MKKATARQLDALRAFMDHVERTGVAPTLRELRDALGLAYHHGAEGHLEALVRKGYLEKTDTRQTYRVLRDLEGRPVALRFVPVDEGAPLE